MGDVFPRFKAAAVQAASVFLDRDATVAKACRLIEEAGGHGADIVAFPEVFVPGFPYWNWIGSPLKSGKYFRDLIANSVTVPSDATEQLGEAAAAPAVTSSSASTRSAPTAWPRTTTPR
jgi:predicted amidohydrolase